MNHTKPYGWHIVDVSSFAIIPLTCCNSTSEKCQRKSSHKNPKSHNPIFWNTYELYDRKIYKKVYGRHSSLEKQDEYTHSDEIARTMHKSQENKMPRIIGKSLKIEKVF